MTFWVAFAISCAIGSGIWLMIELDAASVGLAPLLTVPPTLGVIIGISLIAAFAAMGVASLF